MGNKNFERELPQGYRLAVLMDATRGKFMVIMLLLLATKQLQVAMLLMLKVWVLWIQMKQEKTSSVD